MKRDIRELFKHDNDSTKTLPENHEQEFIDKLKKVTNRKSKNHSITPFLKIAASFLLVFSIGYLVLNQKRLFTPKQTALELQVQQIENQYLKEIDDEWKSFIKVTKDQKLINRYEEKLKNLDGNYIELLENFKENSNNISALEDLISNLQTRLQLLKDIQDHIKILNTKNETYETIIL